MRSVLEIDPVNVTSIIVFFLVSLVVTAGVFGQGNDVSEFHTDPERLVRHLYDQVTFPAGKTPDWDYVRTMFIKEATVVMRAGKNKTNVLSLDGWVLDFVNFIHDSEVKETGFQEKVVKTKSMVFGDIAHVLVLEFNK